MELRDEEETAMCSFLLHLSPLCLARLPPALLDCLNLSRWRSRAHGCLHARTDPLPHTQTGSSASGQEVRLRMRDLQKGGEMTGGRPPLRKRGGLYYLALDTPIRGPVRVAGGGK